MEESYHVSKMYTFDCYDFAAAAAACCCWFGCCFNSSILRFTASVWIVYSSSCFPFFFNFVVCYRCLHFLYMASGPFSFVIMDNKKRQQKWNSSIEAGRRSWSLVINYIHLLESIFGMPRNFPHIRLLQCTRIDFFNTRSYNFNGSKQRNRMQSRFWAESTNS